MKDIVKAESGELRVATLGKIFRRNRVNCIGSRRIFVSALILHLFTFFEGIDLFHIDRNIINTR